MAITQNTLIGKTKQSVGNATFTTWKGKNVLKSKPITVGNPKTLAQQKARKKFASLTKLAKAFMPLTAKGFAQAAAQMTVYNAFMKANPNTVSVNNSLVVTYSADDLVIGQGSLMPVIVVDALTTVGGIIEVSWTDNTGQGNAQPNDEVYVAIFNPLTAQVIVNGAPYARQDQLGLVNAVSATSPLTQFVAYAFTHNPSTHQSGQSTHHAVQ